MGKGQGSIRNKKGSSAIKVSTDGLSQIKTTANNLENYSWLSQFPNNSSLHKLSPALLQQVQNFLDNPDIKQERKDAFLAQVSGMQSNMTEPGILDGLSEMFIGTSNQLKSLNKLGTDIGSLVGQYGNTQYQEDFESAAAQEARLRNAGSNPDIQSLDAGNAQDFDDQAISPAPPTSAATDDFSGAVGVLGSVIQGVFGYISAIQGIVRNGIELEDFQTSQISNENTLVRDMVLSSGFVPDAAISFDSDAHYPDSNGTLYKFTDDSGKPIPFSKLSKGQRDALKNLVDANGFANVQLVENLFKGSGFSRNKINRLKGRVSDYLSSERFLSDWYGQYASHLSNKLSGNVDSESVFMKVFDNLFTGVSNALSKSDYYTSLSKNAYDKTTYDELLKSGVPKEEAELRARVAQRDKADNLVFDEFRSQMLKVLDPSTPEGKKADKWDKLGARIGLVLLYLARQKMK